MARKKRAPSIQEVLQRGATELVNYGSRGVREAATKAADETLDHVRGVVRFFDKLHREKHGGDYFNGTGGMKRKHKENLLDYMFRVYRNFDDGHPFKKNTKQARARRAFDNVDR